MFVTKSIEKHRICESNYLYKNAEVISLINSYKNEVFHVCKLTVKEKYVYICIYIKYKMT